jgi:hypothetical protein
LKKAKHPFLFGKNLTFGLVCFVMCIKFLQAQVYYSTNPNYINSKEEGNNLLSRFKSNYPDTTLLNYHQAFPVNFLGNMGMPSPNYFIRYGSDALGFRFNEVPYQNDLIKEKNIVYNQTMGPYVAITGITGSKQLQNGNILYSQTYANRLSLTFNINRFISQGFYLQQQTFSNHLFLSTHYKALNQRWGFYAYVLNNGNKNQENGGIINRVLNDSTVSINKQLLRVRLSNASRDNRQIKLMFNPWFKLNAKDSGSSSNHFLQLKSAISLNSLKYKDLQIKRDAFYKTINYDSTRTNDSSNFRQLSNSLLYNFSKSNQKFNWSIGYKNEINRVWQKKDSVFMNHLLVSDFLWRSFNAFDTLVNRGFESISRFEYVMSSKNLGNYKLENNSVYFTNMFEKSKVYFNVMVEKRNADYIYNTWRSNHFIWNNQFAAQEQTQAELGFVWKQDFSINCLYQNIFKYLYFDELAMPAQLKQSIDNFVANINYTHVFFKHLGISLGHIYQSTSKAKYYRVPENITTAKLFYDAALFKNNLLLQIGSQVSVYQSFKALDYMPATQAFYLQTGSSTAALPFVDVYLNARLHPVSFFLKVENVLQGMVGNNYSFVPGYYQTDRAFRCGLTWLFFD